MCVCVCVCVCVGHRDRPGVVRECVEEGCVCVCVWCTLVRVSPPQVVQVTDEAKFSSSAVDTKAFLLQMGSFWQNLSWPVASEAYGFTVTIIQAGGIRIVFV